MQRTKDGHIAAFDLARFVDEEMSALEREALMLHVESCPQCTKALGDSRRSLASLTEVALSATPAALLDESSRTHLYDSLQTISDQRRERASWYHGLLHSQRYAGYALVLLLTVGFIAGLMIRRARRVTEEAVLLPNKALTPGAVRNVALSELCQVADDENDLDPVVSVPTQKVIFGEYGISPEESKINFQMDYLINPQLGGVDDVRNLWPQPYSSEWNARAKDALERHLHQMVCEHKIELADAQREIAENWIDAYKKYFHTSKPI